MRVTSAARNVGLISGNGWKQMESPSVQNGLKLLGCFRVFLLLVNLAAVACKPSCRYTPISNELHSLKEYVVLLRNDSTPDCFPRMGENYVLSPFPGLVWKTLSFDSYALKARFEPFDGCNHGLGEVWGLESVAGVLIRQIKSFNYHKGWISESTGEVLQGIHSLQDAKIVCREDPSCEGFAFEGTKKEGASITTVYRLSNVPSKPKWNSGKNNFWHTYIPIPLKMDTRASCASVPPLDQNDPLFILNITAEELRNDGKKLKQAYREQARALHPDKWSGNQFTDQVELGCVNAERFTAKCAHQLMNIANLF